MRGAHGRPRRGLRAGTDASADVARGYRPLAQQLAAKIAAKPLATLAQVAEMCLTDEPLWPKPRALNYIAFGVPTARDLTGQGELLRKWQLDSADPVDNAMLNALPPHDARTNPGGPTDVGGIEIATNGECSAASTMGRAARS